MLNISLILGFRFGYCDPIAENIQLLSPKKLGVFTESFLKNKRLLKDSDDIHYDAVDGIGNRVEIKASRVLMDKHDGFESFDNKSLLDVLNNDVRKMANFSKAIDGEFKCNIQQVKPDCFDYLDYLLLFSDCIMEFRIPSDTIKGTVNNQRINKEVSKSIKTYQKKYPDICKILNKYLNGENNISYVEQICLNHFDNKAWYHILDAIKEKRYIGYSDKQHKGNSGEGQFHIKKGNISYHLKKFLVNIYSYEDFKDTLNKCEI